MKKKNKNIFVGIIGIGLIVFNLLLGAIILSPYLLVQKQDNFYYQIIVMEYPEICNNEKIQSRNKTLYLFELWKFGI